METTATESNASNSYIQSAQSTFNSIASTIYNHPATEKIANLASSTGEQIKGFVDRTFVSDEEAAGGATPGFEGPGSFPAVAKPIVSDEEKPSEVETPVEVIESKVTSEPQNVAALDTTPASDTAPALDTTPALDNTPALDTTPALSDSQHGFATITQSLQNTVDNKDKMIPTGSGVGTDGKGERDPTKTNPRAWVYDPTPDSAQSEYKTSWGETLKMGSGEGRGADTVKLGELEDTTPDQQASNSSSESEEDESGPQQSKMENIPTRSSEETEYTSNSSNEEENKKEVKEKKPRFGKLKAKLKKVF